LRFHRLAPFSLSESGGTISFRVNHAGTHGVDANFARAKFFRENFRGGLDGCLRSAVHRRIWRRNDGGERTDVDDASALRPKMFGCFLRGEEQAEDVEIEVFVKVVGGNALDRGKLVDSGIVDKNIEPAEGFLGFGEEAYDVGFLGNVGLNRDGFAPLLLDFCDDAVGSFLAGRIVHDDGSAFGCKLLGDCGADAFGRAGYHGDVIC